MLNLNQTFKPSSSLVWRNVEDGVVIVSPAGGEVRALNQLGSTIWTKLDGTQSLNMILQELEGEYPSVSAEDLKSDLLEFVDSLFSRNMLEICHEPD